MKILLNATMIQSEGGVALLRALLEAMEKTNAPSDELVLYVNPALTNRLNTRSRIRIIPFRPAFAMARFWWEQVTLPGILKKENCDRLVSLGNTGPLFPGCLQTLYVQQSIPYTDYVPPTHRFLWRRFQFVYGLLMAIAQLGSNRIVLPTGWLVPPMRRWTLGLIPAVRYVVSLPGAPDVSEDGELSETETALLSQLAQWQAQGVAVLFYPAYLAPYKNLPYLFESIALLRQRTDTPFRLVLTFDAESPEYFPCKTNVFEAYRRFRLSENEVLFAGSLSRAAVSRVYRHARLLLFPSLVETLGLPLMEAMTCGVPVVSCQTPFARDICGDAALYAPSDNPEAFAAQVASLLADPARCEVLTTAAKTRVAGWSWEAHAGAVLGR